MISSPVKFYGIEVGTYYSTMIIFMYVISIVETGLITFFLMDIVGYDYLFIIFGIFGTIGLCMAFFIKD